MIRKLSAYFICLALVAGLLGAAPAVAAPFAPMTSVSLTGGIYAQDFDSLANSGSNSLVPDGWAFAESGSNANTTYTAGTGSSTAGDTYSFGTASSTERAFGTLRSGSLIPTIGVEFTNDTGAPISSLAVSYNCEQWRVGVSSRGAADRLDFQYSIDATSLSTGSWIDVDNLDCLSTNISDTVGAKDGNSSSYRNAVIHTIAGLDIPVGATFWIRWTDFNISDSDDGLGVDDFNVTPANPTAVTLADFSAEQVEDFVRVTWETVSELTNAGFNLYRGDSGVAPQTLLAYLPSQAPGSAQGFAYSYEDLDVQPDQTYWYWLEDIDLNGATTLHGPVSATMSVPTAVTLSGMSAGEETDSAALPWAAALVVVMAGALIVRRGHQQNHGH